MSKYILKLITVFVGTAIIALLMSACTQNEPVPRSKTNAANSLKNEAKLAAPHPDMVGRWSVNYQVRYLEMNYHTPLIFSIKADGTLREYNIGTGSSLNSIDGKVSGKTISFVWKSKVQFEYGMHAEKLYIFDGQFDEDIESEYPISGTFFGVGYEAGSCMPLPMSTATIRKPMSECPRKQVKGQWKAKIDTVKQ